MKIKVYQIYYDESQKKSLMDGFVPYFNKKATINFESDVICDLVDNGKCSDCDWFGVFSWKVNSKLRKFNFDKIKKVVGECGEVDLIGNEQLNSRGRLTYRQHNIRKANFNTMGGLWPCLDLIVKKLGITKQKVLTGRGYAISFNAFIAKPSVYSDYVNNLLKPAINLCNNDDEVASMVRQKSSYENGKLPPNNFTKDTGFEYYPWIPFILERLINVYVEINNLKVAYKL